jgi:hypothetical protein
VFEAFRYVFGGEKPFASAILLSLLLFIPIVGQIVLHGVQASIMQRLVRRDPGPMPVVGTSDVGALLTRGGPAFVSEMLLGFVGFLPMAVLGAVTLVALEPGVPRDAFAVFSLIFFAGSTILMPIWNAVVTRAAISEDIGAAFKLRPLLSYVRRTWWTMIYTYVLFTIIAVGLMAMGALVCGVGMYPAMVVGQLALAHLRWQIYERQLAEGGGEIPLKAPAFAGPRVDVPPGGYAWPQAGQPQAQYEPVAYESPADVAARGRRAGQ